MPLEDVRSCSQGDVDVKEMAKTNPFDFIQQVRSEAAKVTWPTRKETMITTAMVFAAAIFFFLVDQVLAWGARLVLGFGA